MVEGRTGHTSTAGFRCGSILISIFLLLVFVQHTDLSLTAQADPPEAPPRGHFGWESWYYYAGGVVNTANGNLHQAFRDLSIPAKGFSLAFARSYNSGLRNYSGPLGWGWTHAYNANLVEDVGGNVTWMDGDGSLHTFVLQGNGSYDHPPGIHSKLEKEGEDSFTLWHKDGSRHLFSSAGLLQRFVDRNENNLTFTYAGGELRQVEDDSGLFLNLTYDGSSRATSVEDSSGRNVSFVYTNGNLTSAFDPMGNESKFDYDANRRLTSYLDTVGKRMARTVDGSTVYFGYDLYDFLGCGATCGGLCSMAFSKVVGHVGNLLGIVGCPTFCWAACKSVAGGSPIAPSSRTVLAN